MSLAVEILSELAARGVNVRVEGDALKLKPAQALDAGLLERVREHKPEILAALHKRPAIAPKPGKPIECRYDWQPGYRGLRLTCVAHWHQAHTATVFRTSCGGDVLLEMLEEGILTGAALQDARRVN